MARSKIIFVNRVYWPNESATAQLLTDLAEALAADGQEVHVIASGAADSSRNSVTIHRTGGPDRQSTLRSRVRDYASFLLKARRSVRRLASPGDVVVIKTDPPLLAAMVGGVASGKGARVVQWIQDIYPEIVPLHSGAWLSPFVAPLQLWRNQSWQSSDACVVVGADMRKTVEQAGVSPKRIFVQPNWAPRELESEIPAEHIARVRTAWALSDKFVIAYSGNLGRVHDFSTFLDAAALLRTESRIAFAIVGSGPRLAEVKAATQSQQLPNVHFFPPVSRGLLGPSLAAADAHIVTLRPGFERLVNPSKLAGVLAVGRGAVFVGPVESHIAAMLRDDRCGAAVATGDAAALAATLRDWSQDGAAAMTERSRAAREAFRRYFRFEDQLAAWKRLLGADSRS